MTHVELKYVQAWVDKKSGAVFRYFRKPGCKRVRLPGLPGSPEFMLAYKAALAGLPTAIGSSRTKPGTVNAAIVGYYQSHEFRALSLGTQIHRRAILERFREAHGDKPIATLPQKFITLTLAELGAFAARNWLKTLRALLQFAMASGWREDNPTHGMRLPPVKTDGHHTWTEEENAAFEVAHPVGSMARLALALLLHTAQRRGDVIRMGRQHVHGDTITVRQQKTGAVLDIPIDTELQSAIGATPASQLTFLVTDEDMPFDATKFSKQFRTWSDAAGLPKACKPHGLRKAACRRLAENGCSANEIAAISGHATLGEVSRYTKAADQRLLARNAKARRRTEHTEDTVKISHRLDK